MYFQILILWFVFICNESTLSKLQIPTYQRYWCFQKPEISIIYMKFCRNACILNIHEILVNLWYWQEITGFKINRPTTTSGILLNFLEWRLSVLFWTIYLVIDIRLSKMTSYQFINRTGHLGNDGWGESHEVVFLVYCWRTSRYGIDGHCWNHCYG